jgi:hypothetical protein
MAWFLRKNEFMPSFTIIADWMGILFVACGHLNH